ncbi:MAG: hypothetical protein JWO94_2249 [Verrucomicrobiaceae bacterium]|nr:hypothetical protein [Verrucomicrobiaceae bacterium]
MKLFFSLFSAAFLAATAAHASNILVYKVVESTTSLYSDVNNPATAPKGFAPKTFVSSVVYYVVFALDSGSAVPNSAGNAVEVDLLSYPFVSPAIDQLGNDVTSKKLLQVSSSVPLSFYFDPLQPLKLANNYLWSAQSGSNIFNSYDSDGDDSDDTFDTYFASRYLKGVGTPLVISKTLTIPNVPRTISGKAVAADWYQATITDEFGYPPYDEFSSNVVTKTWTLDTALTTGANTISIGTTADLGAVSSVAAGTLENGLQRVHNLLYAQGYRVEPAN